MNACACSAAPAAGLRLRPDASAPSGPPARAGVPQLQPGHRHLLPLQPPVLGRDLPGHRGRLRRRHVHRHQLRRALARAAQGAPGPHAVLGRALCLAARCSMFAASGSLWPEDTAATSHSSGGGWEPPLARCRLGAWSSSLTRARARRRAGTRPGRWARTCAWAWSCSATATPATSCRTAWPSARCPTPCAASSCSARGAPGRRPPGHWPGLTACPLQ